MRFVVNYIVVEADLLSNIVPLIEKFNLNQYERSPDKNVIVKLTRQETILWLRYFVKVFANKQTINLTNASQCESNDYLTWKQNIIYFFMEKNPVFLHKYKANIDFLYVVMVLMLLRQVYDVVTVELVACVANSLIKNHKQHLNKWQYDLIYQDVFLRIPCVVIKGHNKVLLSLSCWDYQELLVPAVINASNRYLRQRYAYGRQKNDNVIEEILYFDLIKFFKLYCYADASSDNNVDFTGWFAQSVIIDFFNDKGIEHDNQKSQRYLNEVNHLLNAVVKKYLFSQSAMGFFWSCELEKYLRNVGVFLRVEQHKSFDVLSCEGFSPLMYCVRAEKLFFVKQIMRLGANVNLQDGCIPGTAKKFTAKSSLSGSTAVMQALFAPEIFKILLPYADIDINDKYRQNIVIHACYLKVPVASFALLLQKINWHDFYATFVGKYSPLDILVATKQLLKYKILISSGYDLQEKFRKIQEPLHISVKIFKQIKAGQLDVAFLLRILQQNLACLYMQDSNGVSLIEHIYGYCSVATNYLVCLREKIVDLFCVWFVEELNRQEKQRYYKCFYAEKEMTFVHNLIKDKVMQGRKLLNNNAINLIAVELIVSIKQKIHNFICDYMCKRKSVVRRLYAFLSINGFVLNSNINQYNNAGQTPLQVAILSGFIDVAKDLLRVKFLGNCMVNRLDIYGMQMPLLLAIKCGYTDIALLLLKHQQINLNYIDNHRWTALTWAVYTNNIVVQQALLEYKADPNLHNSLPPLLMAIIKQNIHAVQLLWQYKANFLVPCQVVGKNLCIFAKMLDICFAKQLLATKGKLRLAENPYAFLLSCIENYLKLLIEENYFLPANDMQKLVCELIAKMTNDHKVEQLLCLVAIQVLLNKGIVFMAGETIICHELSGNQAGKVVSLQSYQGITFKYAVCAYVPGVAQQIYNVSNLLKNTEFNIKMLLLRLQYINATFPTNNIENLAIRQILSLIVKPIVLLDLAHMLVSCHNVVAINKTSWGIKVRLGDNLSMIQCCSYLREANLAFMQEQDKQEISLFGQTDSLSATCDLSRQETALWYWHRQDKLTLKFTPKSQLHEINALSNLARS